MAVYGKFLRQILSDICYLDSSPASVPPLNPTEVLEHIDVTNGLATFHDLGNSVSISKWLKPTSKADRSLKIFLIPQARSYHRSGSDNRVALCRGKFENLLEQLEVLPSFLELLNSNNGGCASHVSFCSELKDDETRCKCGAESARAFHVIVKIGNWWNNESCFYVRYDFHTGHVLVLIAGSDTQIYCRDLMARTSQLVEFGLFEVLLDCTSFWLREAERLRFLVDSATQRLENLTGFSALVHAQAHPIPSNQLRLGPDLFVTADFGANIVWGSARIRKVMEFLQEQIQTFENLTAERPEHRLSLPCSSNLRSAFAQGISLAEVQYSQLMELTGRMERQLEVTKAMTAQRDTQTSLEIAQSAKRDSELMRGIAVVTMIFLPATFMATFFSMVFFHVGNEKSVHLTVDRQIWLYPTVTVPLTVLVGWWYFFSSKADLGRFVREKLKQGAQDDHKD